MYTLSRIAYCFHLDKIRDWSCKLCSDYPGTMTNVTVVSNTSLGMQLFVGVDPHDGPEVQVVHFFVT